MLSKRLLAAPAIGIAGYFALGLTVVSFGPLDYRGYQSATVAAYVGLNILFFSSCFVLGSRTRLPRKSIWRTEQNQNVLTFIFRASLVIAVLLMTYEFINAVRAGGLNLNLADSALAYVNTYADYTRNSGSYNLRFLITSMGAFPVFVAQVLGIFYFKELDRTTRFAVIYLFVVTILVYTLGGGKQKQFGDIMIYVVSVVLAKQAAFGKLKLKSLLVIGAVIVGGVYVLLMLLAFRYQAIGIDLTQLNRSLHPLIDYNEGYWLENAFGEAFAFPMVMFSGYLGQGYYGLSLSMEQPFTWTSFAGSSYSISVILNQFFGADFWVTRNYPYMVGYATGWDQAKWHTVFAWLASDLTFTGVVFFMGAVGFIYGRAWREILLYQNPFALMIFALMNIGITYAPANNQLMHSPGGVSTTFAAFIVYFLFHANFNAAPTIVRKLRFRIT
ncbi:hypothetical protein [Sulfitobacter sp. R18_1]|uniref:hypothetical protein n=1 Tax=Sulfitobacter sp. R18_1 TaxID=2821104 RepID=UPI001ADB188E|nr:hypothetical protein [Sulfitobacter sp. R18_1]MBO9432192.1 hypothetical protein [Sulfitobacter sp. R18_1]